jgi:hypothetical protein
MMTTRLLKRSVPVAVMGTALGLLGVSAGDNGHHDGGHDKDHDRDCDKDHDKDHDEFCFKMVVSDGAKTCLPHARAQVTIEPQGPVEKMHVEVSGLRPNTDFDFFVIQLAIAPFGMSWYQGDIETDQDGRGSGDFIGRFSIETFIVAPPLPPPNPPNQPPAPVVHHQPPFPDAASSPSTFPIHTYHLGLWFNSPQDAKHQGCPDTVTPFNGVHHAGLQVLNTNNFPQLQGPLINVKP